MTILEGCSHAIFEVSISDGHLMEIERASLIKNLKVLLIFQQHKVDAKPTVTRMILTLDFKKRGYQDLEELDASIRDFLSNL